MPDPDSPADHSASLLTQVQALYRFARTTACPTFREELLNALSRAVDYTHVAINCIHDSGHVSSFGRGFADDGMGPAWLEMAGPEHDLLTRRVLLNEGTACIVNWPDTELQSDAGHLARRFMLHFNIRHALGIALRLEGAYGLILISLCRRAPDKEFSKSDALGLSTLGPHLAEALMINRLRSNSTMSLRDDTTAPMALATPDRWLIYPNVAFAAIWAAMATTDPALRIPRVPLDWLDGTPETPSAHGWNVRCTLIEDGLRVELLPTGTSGPTRILTQRESEVASLYRAGYSHKEIGRLLSMAPNTVRGHIGRIFEKLDISSRAQLRIHLEHSASPLVGEHGLKDVCIRG